MTKRELVEEVSRTTGYEPTAISEVIDASIEEIKFALAKGKKVYFRGFGVFSVALVKERIARDIRRCKNIVVPAHNVAKFKPYPELEEMVK